MNCAVFGILSDVAAMLFWCYKSLVLIEKYGVIPSLRTTIYKAVSDSEKHNQVIWC
jgi:hypothetical protein